MIDKNLFHPIWTDSKFNIYVMFLALVDQMKYTMHKEKTLKGFIDGLTKFRMKEKLVKFAEKSQYYTQ